MEETKMKRQLKFRCWDATAKIMTYGIGINSAGEPMSHEIYHRSWNIEIAHPPYPNLLEVQRGFEKIKDGFTLMQFTGLKDKNGNEIYEGDIVSLDGNITADNSMGILPNGWNFGKDDQYEVFWGELAGWELRMEVKSDSPYNAKYLNHARSLLIGGRCEIIGNIYEHPHLLNKNDPQKS